MSINYCALCGAPIAAEKGAGLRRVLGWTDQTLGKKVTVYAPTAVPQYAHRSCVEDSLRSPAQSSLF
jgi:hypothetical protein